MLCVAALAGQRRGGEAGPDGAIGAVKEGMADDALRVAIAFARAAARVLGERSCSRKDARPRPRTRSWSGP
jgi:hypothetical protein